MIIGQGPKIVAPVFIIKTIRVIRIYIIEKRSCHYRTFNATREDSTNVRFLSRRIGVAADVIENILVQRVPLIKRSTIEIKWMSLL